MNFVVVNYVYIYIYNGTKSIYFFFSLRVYAYLSMDCPSRIRKSFTLCFYMPFHLETNSYAASYNSRSCWRFAA